jgi:hypothetical protein
MKDAININEIISNNFVLGIKVNYVIIYIFNIDSNGWWICLCYLKDC